MKLLTKSQVDQAKAVDRRREVEEGMKLAGRVDTLREVVAEEEAALEKFRRETVAAIGIEIGKESKKRDLLKTEVQELEERKAEALKPLTEKWAEVVEASDRNAARERKISEVEQTLGVYEESLDTRDIELQKTEAAAQHTHADANDRLRDAASLKEEAAILEQQAEENLRQAIARAETVTATAAQREEWVSAREEAVFKKEEELRAKEIDLAKQYSALVDREQMFERDIKRNK